MNRLLEQVIPIPAPPRGAVVVDLVFNVTWATLVLNPPPHGPGLRWDPELPKDHRYNVLRFRIENRGFWSSILPWMGRPCAPLQATVYSFGGFLDLVKIIFRWQNFSPIQVLLPIPGICWTDPDAYLVPPNKTPLNLVMKAEDYYDEVENTLTSVPQDIKGTKATRYRKYFAELNRETHEALLGVREQRGETVPNLDERRKAVDWLVRQGVLERRVKLRADGLKQTGSCPQAEPVDPVNHPSIRLMSDVQLQVIANYFGDVVVDAKARADFQEAYEMFANGDLRYQLATGAWTTQPSCGFYFFFAEFALLAIDIGASPKEWRQLAPSLVRTQPIFARVYRPANPDTANFDSYRGCNYSTMRIFTPSERQDLVAALPYPNEAALCAGAAQNAVDFLPGILEPVAVP